MKLSNVICRGLKTFGGSAKCLLGGGGSFLGGGGEHPPPENPYLDVSHFLLDGHG